MTIQVGDKIPQVMLGIMTENGPGVISSSSLFDAKRIAVFGLPGAFTKTCSSQHLPGFVKFSDEIKANGIDEILCLSVNDPWVMEAWGKSQIVGSKIKMIADGSLNFTRAMGLELDLSEKCYGLRCKRFSMVAIDGVVKILHLEKGGFGETSAEQLIKDLTS